MKLDLSKIITGESIFYWSRVIIIGVVLGISIQFVVAWTEPGGVAPTGNVGAPINTSSSSQYKNTEERVK